MHWLEWSLLMDKLNKHSPPKWADIFLEWYCSPHQLEDVQGALYEYFYDRVEAGELKKAKMMYWLDVFTHFRPHIINRKQTHYKQNNLGMYKNFIKLSFRNMKRQKLTSTLNLVGLSIGIASFLMIMVWVNQEKTFDAFHENAENIYRIPNTFKSESEEFTQAVSGPALGAQLHKLFPQITNACRFGNSNVQIKAGNENFFESGLRVVDASYFDMFTWDVTAGSLADFFSNPNSIVLTKSASIKFFGTEDSMGKTLIMDEETSLSVSGIIEDAPSNSQMQFSSFISMDLAKIIRGAEGMDENWGGGQFHTYLQLAPGTDRVSLMAEVNKLITAKLTFFTERNMSYHYFLQPLTSIHLESTARYDFANNGSARNVSIFTNVAYIILLLACINYVNLTTANAIKRAKEVGVKKLIGAHKGQLIIQYLVESVITTILSAILGLGMIYMLLPSFEMLIGYEIVMTLTALNAALIFGGTIVLGLIAGFLPAFAISSFHPLSVLKGQLRSGKKGAAIRKSLVVFQFTATIALIIAIITVNRQMSYLQNQDLGMNTSEIISINYRGLSSVNQNKDVLRNKLLEHPKFKAATFYRNAYPVAGLSNGTVLVENGSGDKVSSSLYHMQVDENYKDTYEIEMAAGRFFSSEFISDIEASVIVNEAAVLTFGWGKPEDAIGKKMGSEPRIRTVIGVVKDFNFEGLHKTVEPLRILPLRNSSNFSSFALKVNLDNVFETFDYLKETWESINPTVPLDYTIMNDDINNQYTSEVRFKSIFSIFSVLSVIIACLGLFGLVTASTNQRIKELGIRKVLGASGSGLVQLISREFLILVIVSLVLAIPLAWYGMEQWLTGFAYRINMDWTFFALAGGIAISISMLTISFQTFKVAYGDPTKTLRHE